jgi:hypothetical protein
MKRSHARIPIAVGVVGAFLLAGCGPNVQMIYEGNVRFEHCYRLDLDPSIAPSHRRACWQDWLARHTYGQSSDRLTHAQQRQEALNRGDLATLPLLGDAGVQQKQVSAPIPMPSNIHSAPPPKAAEATPTAAPPASASATTKIPVPPEGDCVNECRVQWEACSPICIEASAASKKPHQSLLVSDAGIPTQKNLKESCAACTATFKVCLRQCFH